MSLRKYWRNNIILNDLVLKINTVALNLPLGYIAISDL